MAKPAGALTSLAKRSTPAYSCGIGRRVTFRRARSQRITLRRTSGQPSHFQHPPETPRAPDIPFPRNVKRSWVKLLRQLFAFFACPSYPCSGFPEPFGGIGG